MDVHDYCKYVNMELSQWKDKLATVSAQMEKLPSSAKQGMYQEVNGVHIILHELTERIEQLRSQCPVSWEPQEDDMAATLPGMRYDSSRSTSSH